MKTSSTTPPATERSSAIAPAGESTPLSPRAATEAIHAAVAAWAGITVHEHRFGGVEFRVGRRELGHLHGSFADLPFPRRERDELVASGAARPHHVLPHSGWITVPTRTAEEVTRGIELFRRNYERTARSTGPGGKAA